MEYICCNGCRHACVGVTHSDEVFSEQVFVGELECSVSEFRFRVRLEGVVIEWVDPDGWRDDLIDELIERVEANFVEHELDVMVPWSEMARGEGVEWGEE